jgi:hypothetical protein
MQRQVWKHVTQKAGALQGAKNQRPTVKIFKRGFAQKCWLPVLWCHVLDKKGPTNVKCLTAMLTRQGRQRRGHVGRVLSKKLIIRKKNGVFFVLLLLTGASQTKVYQVSCLIKVISWWFPCVFPIFWWPSSFLISWHQEFGFALTATARAI